MQWQRYEGRSLPALHAQKTRSPMDSLTFVTEFTKATAWPLAAVVIAVVFKGQIRELLSRLKKGKMGPAEFEFEEGIKKLRDEARELDLPQVLDDIGAPILFQTSPNAQTAILNAWLDIEDAIADLARRVNVSHAGPSLAPLSTLRALEKAELIRPEQAAIVRDLRRLRNRATHERDFAPPKDTVISYVQTARGIARVIRETALNSPSPAAPPAASPSE